MANLVQSLTLPLVTVVGLIVLIALGDVSANVGIPVIVTVAGVHIGANLPTTIGTTPTPVQQSSSSDSPVIQ